MSDVRFIVKRYIDEGFVPLPVKPGEKATCFKAWTTPDVKAGVDDFAPDDNVALRLDGMVDVDCDCDEARALAPALLPFTGLRHARPSRGVAHYFYRCDDAIRYKFKDHTGKVLVEVRGSCKDYTIVPPSRMLVNKDDPSLGYEEVFWDQQDQRGSIGNDESFHHVRNLAVATLIARSWPRHGRHNFLVALAGFLSRTKVSEIEAIQILQQITLLKEGEIWADCDPAVRDSYAKLTTGKTSGIPTLEASIGKEAVGPLLKWFEKGSQAASGGDKLPQPLTEAGDAEAFAEMYRDRVRYDHRQGRWLVSNEESGIWVPDPVEMLTQMTIEMMRARQKDAIALEGFSQKAAVKWTLQGESRKRIMNALALAKSIPPIADSGEHWDEDPYLLGCPNGVVDLRTGAFRQAHPDEAITMRVRVPFDAAAQCPLWLSTLTDIFGGSEEMVSFLQRALGYSITGDCREECCFFTWGDGCNGKGTIMNTLGWLLGDYTDDMPYSTLEKNDRGSGIPNDVAKLDRKRFITCSEVNEFNLNEARLKALTGRDPMTARFLNHEFFTFIPVCKIWVATNNKPKIVGQDDGIWRRIYLIPFTQNFVGRENKQLKDQLRSELPGIFNWLVAGSKLWIEQGLQPPEAVRVATASYRLESNPITPFIEHACVVGESFRVRANQVFKAYEDFCHERNIDSWRRLTEKPFSKAMRQVFKVQEGRHVFYLGVGLKERSNGQEPETQDVPF